ncbi:hypothetical protein DPMN_141386 [Dreissena polymorpha]|uniref:Uncharacterized protein n=1 Tax=Dreissena polymorpha TaxID=45954 RepID=A0A9D4JL80_DREPO|nr:hypothetical protein DPMN_141386 [Dreissena polymorpha]
MSLSFARLHAEECRNRPCDGSDSTEQARLSSSAETGRSSALKRGKPATGCDCRSLKRYDILVIGSFIK